LKIVDFCGFFWALKLAFSMHRNTPCEVDFLHFPLLFQEVPGMKLRTLLAGAALAALFAAAPVVAHAELHHDGDWDEHHAWHNSDWWHDNHPGWVYRHHPEWAETHNDWRRSDGDWDDHHAWHNRSWWYENRPDWVREHHHDWTRWHDDD